MRLFCSTRISGDGKRKTSRTWVPCSRLPLSFRRTCRVGTSRRSPTTRTSRPTAAWKTRSRLISPLPLPKPPSQPRNSLAGAGGPGAVGVGWGAGAPWAWPPLGRSRLTAGRQGGSPFAGASPATDILFHIESLSVNADHHRPACRSVACRHHTTDARHRTTRPHVPLRCVLCYLPAESRITPGQ